MFVKGQSGNPKGRKPGAENKSTEKARRLFMDILAGQVERINDALDEIYEKDKIRYMYILNKLLPYFVARKMDITSDGESLTGFKVEITRDANKDEAE